MAEWRGEMFGLEKPPDVKRAIEDVLYWRWMEYINRLSDKVILLLTHVCLPTQFTV